MAGLVCGNVQLGHNPKHECCEQEHLKNVYKNHDRRRDLKQIQGNRDFAYREDCGDHIRKKRDVYQVDMHLGLLIQRREQERRNQNEEDGDVQDERTPGTAQGTKPKKYEEKICQHEK